MNQIRHLKTRHFGLRSEIDQLDRREAAALDEIFFMELRNHLLKETLFSYITINAVDLNAPHPSFCQRGADEFVFLHDFKSFQFRPDKLVLASKGEQFIDRFRPGKYQARNMQRWVDVALRSPFDPRYSGHLRNLRGDARRKAIENDQTREVSFIFFESDPDAFLEFCCATATDIT